MNYELFVACLKRFRLISHPFENLHNSLHTHPIPTPMRIRMRIPLPTAALLLCVRVYAGLAKFSGAAFYFCLK